jgi:hypothetical protein
MVLAAALGVQRLGLCLRTPQATAPGVHLVLSHTGVLTLTRQKSRATQQQQQQTCSRQALSVTPPHLTGASSHLRLQQAVVMVAMQVQVALLAQ